MGVLRLTRHVSGYFACKSPAEAGRHRHDFPSNFANFARLTPALALPLRGVMNTIKIKDEPTLLAIVAIILAVAALWAVGCGGGGATASTTPTSPSTTPTTPAPATPSTVTVNIVGTTGSAAFTPNPVPAAAGATIAFKNTTSVIHHIVLDDGTVIGDIAVGATVNATVKGSGGNYHCTNHPTMVGSINGASAPPDPMPNPSGGYDY
jgi:plastocyanin